MAGEPASSARRLGCPVCRSPMRGKVLCPRCGADLSDLMRVLARAHLLRSLARGHLLAGDLRGAVDAASESVALEEDAAGVRLLCLARMLAAAEGLEDV